MSDAIKHNTALVVSSCDKYEDAWYPYFELIKKYWPGHPDKIYLITETKSYSCEGLDIVTVNSDKEVTWSERLYRCLENIDEEFIIFSLEDFFLLDYVKEDKLEKCYQYMKENSDIAVCRLQTSDNENLKKSNKYEEFYIADNTIGFRLETQVALWNRKTLMSFIDLSEDPWQFEGTGTKRIYDTDKVFLWLYSRDPEDLNAKIFPYIIIQECGYGIAWGKWLWKNKKWFEANKIHNVNYKRLGILSERDAKRRIAHLYNHKKSPFDKFVYPIWRRVIQMQKVGQNIRIFGIKEGIKNSIKQYKEKK